MPLSSSTIATLRESFALYDADRDGRVTMREMASVLRSSGFALTNLELALLGKAISPTIFGYLSVEELLLVADSLPSHSFCALTPEQTLAHLRAALSTGVLASPSQPYLLCHTGEGLTLQEYASLSLIQSHSIKYGHAAPAAAKGRAQQLLVQQQVLSSLEEGSSAF